MDELLFFFSSRRRHTRSKRDWSSDVCSSDLSLAENPRLARWLRVHRDGTVSVYSGKVEIGQGILTALAQIAAAALEIAPTRIRMVAAGTDASPDEGVTSGSLSIQ